MSDSPWKVWERTCAERFSLWLSGRLGKESPKVDEARIVCRQSLMGRMVERKYGDMAIHPDCAEKYRPAARWFMEKFHVDAKKRAAFRLPGLLTSPLHQFWDWWMKITNEAGAGGKYRLMVLLDHNSKAHILAIGEKERNWLSDTINGIRTGGFPYMVLKNGGEEIILCEFEKFLKWADPQMLGCPEIEKDGTPS